MHKQPMYLAHLVAVAAVMLALSAHAQKQTDVAASIYGAFNASTTSVGVTQSAADAAGALLEVRRIVSPWIGFEATYSYNRANQSYITTTAQILYPPCPTSGNCPPIYKQPIAAVSANAHSITGNWVFSRKMRNLRPFALAGGGLLLFIPSGGQSTTQNAAEFTFLFGAGLDWKLSQHLGLRLQDRIAIYKTPILAAPGLYPSLTDSSFQSGTTWNEPRVYTHSQQPALGVYYRF